MSLSSSTGSKKKYYPPPELFLNPTNVDSLTALHNEQNDASKQLQKELEDLSAQQRRGEQDERQAEIKREKHRNNQNLRLLNTAVNNTLRRYASCKNPVMRSQHLLDKLFLVLDFGMAAIVTYNEDLPADLQKDIESTIQFLKDEMMLLYDQIGTSHNWHIPPDYIVDEREEKKIRQ